jgi:sec-independent protein translocase protein TatC
MTDPASPAPRGASDGGESQQRQKLEGEMHLFEHLAELRTRIIHGFVAVTCATLVAYVYSKPIFELLSQPFYDTFPNAQLIGTAPAEALVLKIKVAFFAGILFTSPFLFYQVWLFVAPGLYESERRMVWPFVACTSSLFLAGCLFCRYGVFPYAFSFFRDEYASIGVKPEIRMGEHLSLVMQMMLAFGAVFEMPVLAYFLGRFGIITSSMMIKQIRYAIVIIFIVAAILTPPDVFSQFLMVIPLLGLYGLSYLIVKHTERSSAAREKLAVSQPGRAP